MTARSIRRAMERKAKKLEKKRLQAETLSEARLLANQANAQLSTGPRSEEGRAKSSLNAVKTALTGRTVLLPSDDTAEYERHLFAYAEEFAPVGLLETNLVQSIADTDWRLRRIPALESALFAKGRIEFVELFNEQDLAARPHLIDAHTFITYEKQIRNLQLQEARLARRRDKEIAELRRLQNERTESRIQKKQQEIPANGFVFSNPPIEPAALPQNGYPEPAPLTTAPGSAFTAPRSA
ncbi:MAG TPA: hypothetical protein VGK64_13555 [Bryobacteraceae bacterium]